MKLLNKITIDWFPVLLFLISIITWRGGTYRFSLYLAIPVLIIYSFARFYRIIISSKYWWPYLLLIIWIFISSLVNDNRDVSLERMIPIVASFLLSFSVYATSSRKKNYHFLYFAYCAFFVVMFIQSYQTKGFVSEFDYANEIDRKSRMRLDANAYAYYSFFLIISARMMFESFNKSFKKLLRLMLYIILLIISWYVALFTASRQVLYLNIPIILMFVYIDFFKRQSIGGSLPYLMAILIVLITLVPLFFQYYSNSYLAYRSQTTFVEDSRYSLFVKAYDVFIENAFWGIGLGAPISFSHSTYFHLASRCGFPALLLYIVMLLKFIVPQIKRYRKTMNTTFLLYFICGLFYFIGNFLYSYIDEPFMMAILFILIGDSERYYKESKQIQCR